MGNSREIPAIQPTPRSQRAGIKKRNYEEYKKYKKEDEGGRLCWSRGGCIDLAEHSRDALGTLPAAVQSQSPSRTCQEKIKFQAFQVTTSWETTRLAMQEKCKRICDSDIELGSGRGQHRKLEEGNAAERVVPIFIELQLTLKYFPAKRPCWPGVGRRLAGLWIQDGRRLSAAAAGKPAAVTGRRVRGPGPAEPSWAPATNTDSQQYNPAPPSLTLISRVFPKLIQPTHLTPGPPIWASTGNGFCGKSGGRGGRNKLARAVTVCTATLPCTINFATVHPPLYNAHLNTAAFLPYSALQVQSSPGRN